MMWYFVIDNVVLLNEKQITIIIMYDIIYLNNDNGH